ncbi:peptidoglycan-binding domain-containing protein [Streptomyces sp. NEAU-S77]|uniref:peptidoglycan-binding domain-containing protein n=1 Tax=Streptomyces sp. NEAU-S77 TaxID=3411033 RepID=UPI003BA17967
MAAETDPDRMGGRHVIEPTAIFRAGPDPESGEDVDGPVEEWMEDLHLFRPPGGTGDVGGAGEALSPEARRFAEDETQEIDARVSASDSWGVVNPPPEPAAPPPEPVRRHPRTAVLIVAGVGLGVALALVLLLPGGAAINVASPGGGPTASDAGRSPTASAAPTTAVPAPPGSQAGVLSQGDSGPQVSELQTRLLKIPDVYRGGQVNGRYDQTLTEAVARFQLWYGIRGDEDGVYGDATRRDLESRTGTIT